MKISMILGTVKPQKNKLENDIINLKETLETKQKSLRAFDIKILLLNAELKEMQQTFSQQNISTDSNPLAIDQEPLEFSNQMTRRQNAACKAILVDPVNQQFMRDNNLTRKEMIAVILATGEQGYLTLIPQNSLTDKRYREEGDEELTELYKTIDEAYVKLPDSAKVEYSGYDQTFIPNDFPLTQDDYEKSDGLILRWPRILQYSSTVSFFEKSQTSDVQSFSSNSAKKIQLKIGFNVKHFLAFSPDNKLSITNYKVASRGMSQQRRIDFLIEDSS